MKKIFVSATTLLLIGLLGFRIWSINTNIYTVPTETYGIGEQVALDGAFQDVITENTLGYSVCVKNATIKSYADFVAQYGETEDYMDKEFRPETVLDVEFEFINEGNSEGHILLFQYYVEGTYFTMNPNSELWLLAVPKGEGQMGFALDENTTYSFHVPYVFPQMDSVNLAGEKVHIVISKMPVKKVIEIQL